MDFERSGVLRAPTSISAWLVLPEIHHDCDVETRTAHRWCHDTPNTSPDGNARVRDASTGQLLFSLHMAVLVRVSRSVVQEQSVTSDGQRR